LRLTPRDAVDVAVLGNSVVAHGVDAEQLATRLQLISHRVKKYVLPGASDLELAMLFSEFERIRPQALVYVTTVGAVYSKLDLDTLRLYDPEVAWALFGPWHFFAERAFHAAGLLAWSHVTIRHRERLVEALQKPLQQFTGVQRAALTTRLQRERKFLAKQSQRQAEDFSCPTQNVEAIGYMARRAETLGTKFIVVAAPLNNDWDSNDDLRALLDSCLQAKLADTDSVYVSRQEARPFPPGAFLDGYHLDEPGREHFTADLARYVHLAMRQKD
jgi:hypothetical protein